MVDTRSSITNLQKARVLYQFVTKYNTLRPILVHFFSLIDIVSIVELSSHKDPTFRTIMMTWYLKFEERVQLVKNGQSP